MKIPALLFGLFMLFGCSETKVSKEPESYTPGQCIIQAIRDSTISAQDQIIGYQFLCEERDTIKKLLFFDDNPWRHVDLPILPAVNPLVSFSNQYETILKQGFIPFDVENVAYPMIKEKFNIITNEEVGDLIPNYAWTQCRYKSYKGEVFLINYILDIWAKPDTFPIVRSNMLHTEIQLKIFTANGEIAYDLKTKDYSCTGALLDSAYRYLFVRTLKPHTNDGITGLEIRDIQHDSILIKLEMDSSYLVVDPQIFGNFVVYEVFTFINNNENDGLHPHHILVFDISNRELLKRKYENGYRFRFQEISDKNLVYSFTGDAERGFEYDTFNIANMEVITSPTQNSKHQ